MSWHPNDLVSDLDLRDYEPAVLTSFGQTTWQARRTKAIEDWLFPILKTRGFNPFRLRTRFDPDQVWQYTSSAYTDITTAAQSSTDDDLNLATALATFATDALYIGSAEPFRGLFVRTLDTVSSATAALTVSYFNGTWKVLVIADGTAQTAGKTLSGGGSVTWALPIDWMTRKVNTSDQLYWVKVTISAVPTGGKASQIGVIRSSSLRAPVVFRTLQLIFQEAPTGADGPWREKADFYKGEADDALQRALAICGGEFDADGSDLVSETEAQQTAESVSRGPFVLERG
jgi:hypothetical protein